MSNTHSFDYEIVQLPDTGGISCVQYQTSQHNWVIIKMLYKYLRRCLLSWHGSRLGFVTSCIEEVSLGPLGNTHQKKLASKVTKELVTRWCIMERVKRLAGNEIELGMMILTIKSRASNILMTKGIAYVVWYVSNVSIIFDCCMLYYLLFWTILGFIFHFYIILGLTY